MSEILSGNDSPIGRREPVGGWAAPMFVVIVVALLASGVFSTDPEVDAILGSATPVAAPALPVGAVDDPATGPAVVDDQADFVEFGFDSQGGVVAPRGEPAASMPARHPGEAQRPGRQM